MFLSANWMFHETWLLMVLNLQIACLTFLLCFQLSDKDKDLLEERIKRVAKSRPASGVKAPSPEPQPKVIGKTPRDITNTKAQ